VDNDSSSGDVGSRYGSKLGIKVATSHDTMLANAAINMLFSSFFICKVSTTRMLTAKSIGTTKRVCFPPPRAMGKRSRHSVKTGDASVSKKKLQSVSSSASYRQNDDDDSDNDGMYNEVERYHNRKSKQEDEDYLQLDYNDNDDNSDDDDDVDDGITNQEGVFDLGVGGTSSEDDDDDEDDDDSEEDNKKVVTKQQQQQRGDKKSSYTSYDGSSDNDISVSDDDDDDDDDTYNKSKILNWGDKKSAYYHGDTADLEIGQDVEDAYLEEEAAREILANQAKDMDEEDYILGGGTGGEEGGGEESSSSISGGSAIKIKKTKTKKGSANNDDEGGGMEIIKSIKSIKNISQLSTQERMKHITTTHPELLPLVSHFSQSANDLNNSTCIATGVMLQNGIVKCMKEMEVRH
jgi:hypothetical protein